MVTGQNTGLSAALLMEQYRRNRLAIAAQHTWVEAGYCIDAPVLIAAGSHERDVFGDGDEDWLPMPTSALRAFQRRANRPSPALWRRSG